MLATLGAGKYNAISCSLGIFNKSSLQALLKVHSLMDTEVSVNKEKKWLKNNFLPPNENCSSPNQHYTTRKTTNTKK